MCAPQGISYAGEAEGSQNEAGGSISAIALDYPAYYEIPHLITDHQDFGFFLDPGNAGSMAAASLYDPDRKRDNALCKFTRFWRKVIP